MSSLGGSSGEEENKKGSEMDESPVAESLHNCPLRHSFAATTAPFPLPALGIEWMNQWVKSTIECGLLYFCSRLSLATSKYLGSCSADEAAAFVQGLLSACHGIDIVLCQRAFDVRHCPMGAWLAVSGLPNNLIDLLTPFLLGVAVLFWLAGFDVIYSLQDYDFDRSLGLHSIPARFGVTRGLRLSGLFHLITVIFLALVGLSAGLGLIYWSGMFAISLILIREHRLVKPEDFSRINRAFFDFNAYVSVGYFLTILGDLLLSTGFGNGR